MLTAEMLREIAEMLAPQVASEGERRALLTAAFGANHPLISQIDLSGAPRPFAINLITRLNNYGELTSGQPALVALLAALRDDYLGADQADRINRLIAALGGQPSAPLDSDQPAVNNRQMRILFMAANPRNTDPLRLGEEIRLIDERLRLASLRDQFDLVQAQAVRVADIQDHLLRYRPQIVHFSGHGSDDGELIFEDAVGRFQPVTTAALGDLFRILNGRVCCVVLNACYSDVQAEAIAAHVDCVIGMKQAIPDKMALEFSGSFYRALGYGETFASAFEFGCNAVMLAGLGSTDLFALHLRDGLDPHKVCAG